MFINFNTTSELRSFKGVGKGWAGGAFAPPLFSTIRL